MPDLLFRVWTSSSNGVNELDTFKAAARDASSLPLSTKDLLSSVSFLDVAARHLNRELFPSPFISMTDSFIWSIAMAIKFESETGNKSYISVMRPGVIAENARILKASLICRELRKKGTYRHRYKGAFEYLVVGGYIRQSAIVTTISFSSLKSMSVSHQDQGIHRLLHLSLMNGQLSMSRIRGAIIPSAFDETTAFAIAELWALLNHETHVFDPLLIAFGRIVMRDYKVNDVEEKWLSAAWAIEAVNKGIRQSSCTDSPNRVALPTPNTTPQERKRTFKQFNEDNADDWSVHREPLLKRMRACRQITPETPSPMDKLTTDPDNDDVDDWSIFSPETVDLTGHEKEATTSGPEEVLDRYMSQLNAVDSVEVPSQSDGVGELTPESQESNTEDQKHEEMGYADTSTTLVRSFDPTSRSWSPYGW